MNFSAGVYDVTSYTRSSQVYRIKGTLERLLLYSKVVYGLYLFFWCVSFTPAEKFINVLLYNQLFILLFGFIHLLLIKQCIHLCCYLMHFKIFLCTQDKDI